MRSLQPESNWREGGKGRKGWKEEGKDGSEGNGTEREGNIEERQETREKRKRISVTHCMLHAACCIFFWMGPSGINEVVRGQNSGKMRLDAIKKRPSHGVDK
jgi:hypothetical protein